MLFNGYPFLLVFFPAVAVGFFALRGQTHRLIWLVAASYVFYAYAAWWFALLMAGSTLVSFLGGLAVAAARTDARPGRWQSRRGLVLGSAIVAVLTPLVFFKYAAFVSGYVVDVIDLLTAEGLPGVESFTAGIVLPIGISFYTFEGISYLVDVHRGDTPVERNPLRFALFISFFPHLIAGPIVRYGMLAPQLQQRAPFDADRVRSGLMLFGIGLAKKTLLADGFAHWSNPYLARPDSIGLWEAWAAMVGFGFQIYFDFSAYSDMALGLARIFGITLPWNFDRPYRAANPSEFWRRWHVSLSTWLRDYLYIPLGGNRHGEVRRDANLLTTMAIGGLWHGAALTFVLWGLWHGMLLVLHRRLSALLPFAVPRVAAVVVTFGLVTAGWVLFRMQTLGEAGDVYLAMLGGNGLGQIPGRLLAYIALGLAITWGLPEEWRWDVRAWGMRRVVVLAAVVALAVISVASPTPFIYFKF